MRVVAMAHPHPTNKITHPWKRNEPSYLSLHHRGLSRRLVPDNKQQQHRFTLYFSRLRYFLFLRLKQKLKTHSAKHWTDTEQDCPCPKLSSKQTKVARKTKGKGKNIQEIHPNLLDLM